MSNFFAFPLLPFKKFEPQSNQSNKRQQPKKIFHNYNNILLFLFSFLSRQGSFKQEPNVP